MYLHSVDGLITVGGAQGLQYGWVAIYPEAIKIFVQRQRHLLVTTVATLKLTCHFLGRPIGSYSFATPGNQKAEQQPRYLLTTNHHQELHLLILFSLVPLKTLRQM